MIKRILLISYSKDFSDNDVCLGNSEDKKQIQHPLFSCFSFIIKESQLYGWNISRNIFHQFELIYNLKMIQNQ